MTERIVILGSGPAAAGVALALTEGGCRDILVLDIGSTLEPERDQVVHEMASRAPSTWTAAELDTVSRLPVVGKSGLPQKRAYGSDFPFRDRGQLAGLDFLPGANDAPISGAFGGFSNVWGAQTMPFSRATFETWPFGWDDIAPHYAAVLREVPLAGEPDDLQDTFPLLTDRARPLPPLAGNTRHVLGNYERHRAQVRDLGITVGRARLALRADECVTCGLCMTGCPYGLIYSASQTFERLRRDGAVRYEHGVLATGIAEDADGCLVRTQSLIDGTAGTVRADRLFVACGGMGSTRLALGSLPNAPTELTMAEAMQFAVPFVSRRSFGDPRSDHDFTLNQFNVMISFDDAAFHTSFIHCYPYNPAVLAALPGPLRHRAIDALTARILARLTIGLGYLPSWASPAVSVRVTGTDPSGLPSLAIGDATPSSRPLMLGRVMRRLKRAAPALDLLPIESLLRVSGPAKSYHFGGSFPHRRDPDDALSTDLLGRPRPWRRIHLVDGAVMPSVPATTFTMTVMANAHRIASASLAEITAADR